jgi:hypothetical protein
MDKSEVVGMAAWEAGAKRGRSSLANRIAPAMGDGKGAVKYTAAAAVVRLNRGRLKVEPPKSEPETPNS